MKPRPSTTSQSRRVSGGLPRPAHHASSDEQRQREQHAVHDQRDRVDAVAVGELDDDRLAGEGDRAQPSPAPARARCACAASCARRPALHRRHRSSEAGSQAVAPRVAGGDVALDRRIAERAR